MRRRAYQNGYCLIYNKEIKDIMGFLNLMKNLLKPGYSHFKASAYWNEFVLDYMRGLFTKMRITSI